MSDKAPTVKIDRNPSAIPPDVSMQFTAPSGSGRAGKMMQASTSNAALSEQMKKRRSQIHKTAAQESIDATIADRSENLAPPPIRDNVEEIEFDFEGRHIVYGPPTEFSVQDKVARIYGRDVTQTEFQLTKLILGIRSIDGRPLPTISSEDARSKVSAIVGDRLLLALTAFDAENWPPLMRSELPILKKKLRT